jgi:hypothetical protein
MTTKKPSENPRPRGRPKGRVEVAPRAHIPIYKNRSELQEEIVAWLSAGKVLAAYCRQEGKPTFRVVYDWMLHDAVFAAAVACARDTGFEALADETVIIADTPLMGHEITDSETGRTVKKADMLGHRKLQIETRLKILACWNPKKYGTKQIISGDQENPLKTETSYGVFDELLKAMALERHNKVKGE